MKESVDLSVDNQTGACEKPVKKSPIRSILSELGLYLLAIAIALAINSVIIIVAGGNVFTSYKTLLEVALGSPGAIAMTLNKCTPLFLAGLAVALGNRGRVFNIGSDGQIYMGAIFACGAGLALEPLNLPMYALSPLVLLAAMIGGGIWCGIPGVLKARFGTSELFTTIMLLFMAGFLTDFFASNLWRDPNVPDSISRLIAKSGYLPKLDILGGAHIGILIAVVVAVLLYLLVERSVLGYNIRAMGDNPEAASLGGINTRLLQFFLLAMSGAIAGLAGGIEVSGLHHRLMTGLSPSYGLMAVLVATVGQNKPVGVGVTAFFFAVLLVGSDSLQRSIGLPASAVMVFQAVVYLCILIARVLRELK